MHVHVHVTAGCVDLAEKENELDRLLSICSSSITTLTKNAASTQYPLNFLFCFFCCMLLWVGHVSAVLLYTDALDCSLLSQHYGGACNSSLSSGIALRLEFCL